MKKTFIIPLVVIFSFILGFSQTTLAGGAGPADQAHILPWDRKACNDLLDSNMWPNDQDLEANEVEKLYGSFVVAKQPVAAFGDDAHYSVHIKLERGFRDKIGDPDLRPNQFWFYFPTDLSKTWPKSKTLCNVVGHELKELYKLAACRGEFIKPFDLNLPPNNSGKMLVPVIQHIDIVERNCDGQGVMEVIRGVVVLSVQIVTKPPEEPTK